MIGILLAAGSAERWNRGLKELLPVAENKWLVDSSINAFRAAGISTIYVVTSPLKLSTHALHFAKPKYQDLHIVYVVNTKGGEMWDSLTCALPHITDCYTNALVLMADTYIEDSQIFEQCRYTTAPLTLGLFTTTQPERFSCVVNDRVVTKQALPITETHQTYKAWGAFVLDCEVASYWLHAGFTHYDEALSSAMHIYGYASFDLPSYEDIANFTIYKTFLTSRNDAKR